LGKRKIMPGEIVVPDLGESVVEATVARWLKKEGDPVTVGEPVVEVETDKANLEVGASQAGVLARIERKEGEDVKVGDVLGLVETAPKEAKQAPGQGEETRKGVELKENATRAGEVPAAEKEPPAKAEEKSLPVPEEPLHPAAEERTTPSARRMAREQNVDLSKVPGSGFGGRITREDVQTHVERQQAGRKVGPAAPPPAIDRSRREERQRMSRRRRTIAQRLLEAQRTAAILTTYNEVDMSGLTELRKRRKESFKERHGVSLGIVSFFVKAAVSALKDFPRLNAEIQGEEIVLKQYYDIGVAIGASGGLVVPVLRDADRMSIGEIEKTIKEYAQKAEAETLSLEELRGGTFTITNGGVFGSLFSTPILNPPEVGILGLHKIEERPIALGGEVAVRPMMYVALSYDHRIVDGRESVQFLARIKELIESPEALLLES
jgi:2-oxoglutarate dehydrogenase E2 component (dihydrolipoamide succinyltransferase)